MERFDSNDPNDKLGTGLTLLSFCIPIAGAIVYFSKKDTQPKSARTACHAALWSMGIGLILNVLMALAGGA